MTDKERYPYIWGCLIGKFSPMHKGHQHLVIEALKQTKYLIILVGSHNRTLDYDVPWTSDERIQMIKAALTEDQQDRIRFQVIEDRIYSNSEWKTIAQEKIDSVLLQYSRYRLNAIDRKKQVNMAIFGYNKDATSFYLTAFPNLKFVELPKYSFEDEQLPLNATDIRKSFYEGYHGRIKDWMPDGTYQWLKDHWFDTDRERYMQEWYTFDLTYEKQFLNQPYSVNFYTADIVVCHRSSFLLIRRNDWPYKDAFAFPGGHINSEESAYDAAIRELREETQINLSDSKLNNSFKVQKLFDAPNRSKRCRVTTKKGRTVTIAHLFVLDDNWERPHVESADDAADAVWVSFADFKNMRNQLMEDHCDIGIAMMKYLD